MANQGETSSKSSCSLQKRNGFHGKYLAICKADNIQPASDVKPKNLTEIHSLDFYGDRLRPYDWIAISNALSTDFTLKHLGIRIRKNTGIVLENMDSLKKVKAMTNHPVILTKYVFNIFINSLQKFLLTNEVITDLALEGFPLSGRYLPILISALRTNSSIKTLNLSRSNIGDEGCELLCLNIKHLPNIETLNLTACELGPNSAESVMNYIKLQRIHRFSEAWASSLRYQDGTFKVTGIRKVILNNNPLIGDKGLKFITDELREDTWVNHVEMQNCGLTIEAAQHILGCLAINKAIKCFDVGNNPQIPASCARQIQMVFNVSDSSSTSSSSSADSGTSESAMTRAQLMERIRLMETHLELEKGRTQSLEELTNDLHKRVVDGDALVNTLNQELQKVRVPQGYTLIRNDVLEEILTEEIEKADNRTIVLKTQRHKRRILRKIKRRARKVKAAPVENLKTALDEVLRPSPPVVPSPDVKNLKSVATQTPVRARSNNSSPPKPPKKTPYFETNIGDYFHNKECNPDECLESDKLGRNEMISFLFPSKKSELSISQSKTACNNHPITQ